MRGISKKKVVEFQPMFEVDDFYNSITFYPLLHIDGEPQQRAASVISFESFLDDVTEVSLSLGATRAICDQFNAGLRSRGLHIIEESDIRGKTGD